MRVDAKAGKRELTHIGTADRDHSGLFQRRHHIGVTGSRRIVRQHRRSGRGRHAFKVEKILPGNWNTVEHAKGTTLANAFGGTLGFRHRPRCRQADKNRLVVVFPNRIERLFRQSTRIEMPALDENGKLSDVFAPVSHDDIP